MAILFGLAAALLWGSGDFLITKLAVAVGTTRSLIVIQSLSLVCWLAAAIVTGFPSGSTPELWGTAIICGVFHVAGLAFTYRAFEIGTLSIVSPVASSFAIVTAILALASGERPGGLALAGAGLLIVGVIVISRGSDPNSTTTLRGVPEALGSALAFGIMFWMIERITPKLGMAWPLVMLKTMATISALAALLFRNKSEAVPARPSLKQIVLLGGGVALSDSLAWAAYVLGTRESFASVVTALASLFSAVTVVMAAFLLKERLSRAQLAGVGVVLLGILLVSI